MGTISDFDSKVPKSGKYSNGGKTTWPQRKRQQKRKSINFLDRFAEIFSRRRKTGETSREKHLLRGFLLSGEARAVPKGQKRYRCFANEGCVERLGVLETRVGDFSISVLQAVLSYGIAETKLAKKSPEHESPR